MLTIRISKSFITGFIAGIILFVVINLYSYSQMEDSGIIDSMSEFGWPYPIYVWGSIGHFDDILWGGLIANISIAINASIVVGTICDWISVRRSAKLE